MKPLHTLESASPIAKQSLANWEEAVAKLPIPHQVEIDYCLGRLCQLIDTFGVTAQLAIVGASLGVIVQED